MSWNREKSLHLKSKISSGSYGFITRSAPDISHQGEGSSLRTELRLLQRSPERDSATTKRLPWPQSWWSALSQKAQLLSIWLMIAHLKSGVCKQESQPAQLHMPCSHRPPSCRLPCKLWWKQNCGPHIWHDQTGLGQGRIHSTPLDFGDSPYSEGVTEVHSKGCTSASATAKAGAGKKE